MPSLARSQKPCYSVDLLIDLFEKILPLFLRKIACFTLDRFAFATVNGDECSPKEIQGLAQDGKFAADSLQRLRILFAKISNRFKIGGEFVQQPQQFQVALAFVFKFSTGANLV